MVELRLYFQQIKTINLMETKHFRKIRSYVLREGRLTNGQQRGIDVFFPIMGLTYQPEPFDLQEVYGRDAPTTLEIGFGMGKSLAEQAQAQPERNFLGIEVHTPGVGAVLVLAEEYNLKNLRVMNHDAVEVIKDSIPDNSLDRVQIFFPDPWHKSRHHKRRIVQTDFCQKLHKKLKVGGILHLATDWENYAHHMLEVLTPMDEFKNISETDDFIPRPDSRPLTKFEARGQRLGHGVWDMMFEKV